MLKKQHAEIIHTAILIPTKYHKSGSSKKIK